MKNSYILEIFSAINCFASLHVFRNIINISRTQMSFKSNNIYVLQHIGACLTSPQQKTYQSVALKTLLLVSGNCSIQSQKLCPASGLAFVSILCLLSVPLEVIQTLLSIAQSTTSTASSCLISSTPMAHLFSLLCVNGNKADSLKTVLDIKETQYEQSKRDSGAVA